MNETPNPCTTDTIGPEKRFEFFQDFIKTLLQLSTGAILFSVTFLHDVVGSGSEKTHPAIREARLLPLGGVDCFV